MLNTQRGERPANDPAVLTIRNTVCCADRRTHRHAFLSRLDGTPTIPPMGSAMPGARMPRDRRHPASRDAAPRRCTVETTDHPSLLGYGGRAGAARAG
jgi:hypothetical protein